MLTQKHYIGYSAGTLITLWILFGFMDAGLFGGLKLSLLLSGFVIPIVLLCVFTIKYMSQDPYASN